MVSKTELLAIEELVVEHAGPLGKFVIKKTITDMGADPESFDEEQLSKFIDTVLERSIYDPAKWKDVKIEILEMCKGD